MVWTCGACSYAENVDARSRCAICDSVKPPSATRRPSPPTSHGAPWACRSCTYMNAPSATKCVVCQADRATSSSPATVATATTRSSPNPPVASRSGSTPSSTATPSATASATPNPPDVSFLEGMGFPRALCLQALSQSGGSRDRALDWLLAEGMKNAPPTPSGAAAAGARSSSPAVPSTTTSSTRPSPSPSASPLTRSTPASASSSSKTSSVTPSPSATPSPIPAPSVKQMTPAEAEAYRRREQQRLELLRQMEEEAKAKARAHQAQTQTHTSTPAPTAVNKKPSTAPKSASAIPAPAPSSSSVSSSVTAKSFTSETDRIRARLEAERVMEAERRAASQTRIQKRLDAESKIRSIDQALGLLRESYDAFRLEKIITLLVKILDNLIRDKGVQEKFRKINMNNPKIETEIVRPIGAAWILKHAGFEEKVVEGDDGMDTSDDSATAQGQQEEHRILYIDRSRIDLKRLESIRTHLSKLLRAQHSDIPKIFQQILANPSYSREQVYHFGVELRKILENICVSCDEIELSHANESRMNNTDQMDMNGAGAGVAATLSTWTAASNASGDVNRNFRTLDKRSSLFQHRIKPIKESKQILALLGFELEPHDATRSMLIVPQRTLEDPSHGGVGRYQIMLREVRSILAQLAPTTPIAQALEELCRKNRQKSMRKMMELLLVALRAITATPHEQKYHRINLEKFQAKIIRESNAPVKGLPKFLQLFGFEKNTQEQESNSVDMEMDDEEEEKKSYEQKPPSHSTSTSSLIDAHVVRIPYPGIDVELLELRTDELEQNWKRLLERSAQEQGKTSADSTWSFD